MPVHTQKKKAAFKKRLKKAEKKVKKKRSMGK